MTAPREKLAGGAVVLERQQKEDGRALYLYRWSKPDPLKSSPGHTPKSPRKGDRK